MTNEWVLIVDDDPLTRKVAIHVLTANGLRCDEASDGDEALQRIRGKKYAAVLTDLQMPNRNGHQLAVDLLAMEDCPLIFILTGIMEPRIAKDLIARGVTDVEFKPTKYGVLASKIKAKIKSKLEATSVTGSLSSSRAALERASLPDRIPLVVEANDVYRMSIEREINPVRFRQLIEPQHLLAQEVIAMANTPVYNRSLAKLTDLNGSILRIGQKRIGQLALVANAQSAICQRNPGVLKTMNELRRSVVAALACELLIQRLGQPIDDEGLLFCSGMFSLSQAFLASVFPARYQSMVSDCLANKKALADVELSTFSESSGQTLVKALASWQLPSQLCEPLQLAMCNFEELSEGSGKLRQSVLIVKLSDLLSRIVLKTWEPWDKVDLPTTELLRAWSSDDFREILSKLRAASDVTSRLQFSRNTSPAGNASQVNNSSDVETAPNFIGEFNYLSGSNGSFDFFCELLVSAGLRLRPQVGKASEPSRLICNYLDLDKDTFPAQSKIGNSKATRLAVRSKNSDLTASHGDSLKFPVSFAALKEWLNPNRTLLDTDGGKSLDERVPTIKPHTGRPNTSSTETEKNLAQLTSRSTR